VPAPEVLAMSLATLDGEFAQVAPTAELIAAL
jgi:hypothetical protein